MSKVHAVWGTDKVFKYKISAALYCGWVAYNKRMDSDNYGKQINNKLNKQQTDNNIEVHNV